MIILPDNYVIDFDENNYIAGQIRYRKSPKTGKEERYVYKPSYHRDAIHAVLEIRERMIKDKLSESDVDLMEAAKIMETCTDKLFACCGELFGKGLEKLKED